MSEPPKVIYLQPWCDDCARNSVDGRLWCEDDVWGKCDECGAEPECYFRYDPPDPAPPIGTRE